jgi:small ligand-binding sensory domain FIST
MFAPEVAVATGLTQGCTPVGEVHTVSDCVDNVLVGLDGESALEVFKRDIGEVLARDPRRVGGYIHAAFPVPGSDTGDYVVRNLVGMDEERGWLAIAADVSAGDRVMFVRRDPASAREDLESMLANLIRRTGGKARGGIYVSCIARGPHMFGEPGAEIAIVKQALGDIPVIGFFANGEISHDRLYSYTGVLTLFL